MALAARRHPGKSKVLFIDPGFPVNKLQARSLGLDHTAFDLADRPYANLKRFHPSERFGEALAVGGLHATGAGVSHSAQRGLQALLAAVDRGRYDFRRVVHVYGTSPARLKRIFGQRGFKLAYERDGAEELADGFYFAATFSGLTGGQLAERLLRVGISILALDASGAARQCVRICISQVRETDFDAVDRRLAVFEQMHH